MGREHCLRVEELFTVYSKDLNNEHLNKGVILSFLQCRGKWHIKAEDNLVMHD